MSASCNLSTPSLQHEVSLDGRKRRLDLAFPDVRLAIEGHSRRHHFSRTAVTSDHARDLELAAAGWEVIYLTWAMLSDPPRLLTDVEQIYHTRRQQLAG